MTPSRAESPQQIRHGQSPTVWSLTRVSVRFCTWDGSPGWTGRLESSTMERELGVLVHGPLDLSQGAQQCPGGHQDQQDLPCPALHWCSLKLSSWGNSGHHQIKKTPNREHPREAMRLGKGLEGKPYEITWFVQLQKRTLEGRTSS